MAMTPEMFAAARLDRRLILGLGKSDGLYLADGATPSDYDVARVTNYSYSEVVAALGPASPPNYCGGSGSIRYMSDDWASCPGCLACSTRYPGGYYYGTIKTAALETWRSEATAAWAVGVFLWRAMNVDTHSELLDSLAGFAALAAIGRCLAGPASLGASLAKFFGTLGEAFETPVVGWTYAVVGKRGKSAKDNFGKSGECTWVGEVESGPRRPMNWRGTWNTTTTLKVKLTPASAEDAAFFVPAGQVKLVASPAGALAAKLAKKAAEAVRPEFTGYASKRGGDIGMVVAGANKGKSGKVFWKGDRNGKGMRVGLEVAKGEEPIWCSARDVVGPAERFPTGTTATERDAAMTGAELNMLALAEAGFDAAAEEWGALAAKMMPAT